MKLIDRKQCVSCNGKIKEEYTIKNFPIYMGISHDPPSQDKYADMVFAKCADCQCIQMKNLIPLEVLYENGHAGSVGKTWQLHHKKFADLINKYATGHLVEVGGAQLNLAKHLEKNDKIETITVYDTNLNCYGNQETKKIKLREEFFDKNSVGISPDGLIHSHVIEHLYRPKDEIKDMADLLEDGAYMFISAPVIDTMMRDGFTNAMNFEHTYGLTKNMMYKILNHAKLKIIEEKDYNKHCVFIVAQKNSQLKDPIPVGQKEDDSYFYDFISFYQAEIQKIQQCLIGDPKSTFVFGGHIFTQFLLKFGLDEKNFACVLDNDLQKQDKRLYGTSLMVRTPKLLATVESPVVLLKAGQYTEEIKEDILSNINPKTRFIL